VTDILNIKDLELDQSRTVETETGIVIFSRWLWLFDDSTGHDSNPGA
jgi:hypothetical protein